MNLVSIIKQKNTASMDMNNETGKMTAMCNKSGKPV